MGLSYNNDAYWILQAQEKLRMPQMCYLFWNCCSVRSHGLQVFQTIDRALDCPLELVNITLLPKVLCAWVTAKRGIILVPTGKFYFY